MRAPAPAGRLPGPRVPALAATIALQRDPIGLLRRASARYGDTFSLPLLPPGRVVVTSSPALVERMFTGDPALLRAGTATSCLLPVLGERALIVRDAGAHRERRRAMLPAFSPQSLEAWAPAIERLVRDHVERWPRGRIFTALPLARRLAFDAIALITGLLGSGLERELADRLAGLASPPVGPAVWLPSLRRRLGGVGPWAVFERRVARIDALLAQALDRRRDPEAAPTVARHLTELARRGVIAREDVVDELRVLLLVGHETATAAIAWTLLSLAWRPEAARPGGDDRQIAAVVQEALRMHPPVVDVVRQLVEPLEIGANRLPAGTILMAAPSLVHRRADLHQAPDEFRADRFLHHRPAPFAWIPFGGGIRRCLGATLAQLELAGVVRAVTAAGRLRPARPAIERARLHGTTLVPADGACVVLEPR